ncbi:hypothetical protein AMTR_s00003p00043230 [Amborella trichopoda]|uniref:Uncharacterized protein n=1 Tax=Amborella trichopoda TaxID=13333 RepID=W1P599_AMBTC|nr:hypothetical protein AMTR_s00003p00043230 [Amborella trichopoda]
MSKFRKRPSIVTKSGFRVTKINCLNLVRITKAPPERLQRDQDHLVRITKALPETLQHGQDHLVRITKAPPARLQRGQDQSYSPCCIQKQ